MAATVYLSPIGNGTQYLNVSALLALAVGGTINTYAAGTTTPQASYTSSLGTIQNATSIAIGPNGTPAMAIWLDVTLGYKIIILDAQSNQIGPTFDNITPQTAAMTIYTPPAGYAASTTVAAELTALLTALSTTGVPPAYAIAPVPAITAYTAGMVFEVTFTALNAGTDTLAINSLASPPNLVKENTDGTYSNVAAGDIPLNHTSQVRLLSPTQALVRSIPTTILLRHGSVRFINVSPFATNVQLYPFNGNGLLVKGASGWEMVALPSVGLTANITSCNLNGTGASTLSNGTLYYAYVAFIGGVPKLDFSTTGHATDASTGVEIKSGDATRTLAGQLYVGTGANGMTAGSIAGTASNQLVSGWFNRIASDEYITVAGSTASVSYAELNNVNRINFVMWSDDDPYCVAQCTLSNNGAAGVVTYFGVGVDSASSPSGVQGTYQSPAANYSNTVGALPITGGASEGFHFLTGLGQVSGNTGTFAGGMIHLYLRS